MTDGSEYRPSIVGCVGQRSVAIDSGDAEQVQSRVIGGKDDGEDVLRMGTNQFLLEHVGNWS